MGSQKQKRQQPRQKQQQQQTSSSANNNMIATPTNNSAAPTISWVGGTMDDGGTVISEITSDHTMLTDTGGDSLTNILGAMPSLTTSGGGGVTVTPERPNKMMDDGSFTDKPTSIKSNHSSANDTKKAGGGGATATTKQPPSASALAKAAAKKAKAMAAGKSQNNNNNNNNNTTSKSRSRSGSPMNPASSNKKAPHPAMDVSPNEQVRKAKTLSSTTTTTTTTTPMVPIVPINTTDVTINSKPSPKTPPRPTSNSTTNNKTAPTSPGGAGGMMPMMMRKPAPPSPNTVAASTAGLSELSKQLRMQRAKNEWQHQEIARLERQLRILSDLKGVSVADLRYSLESACAEEAHDELRNQVLSLQAQLEALQMQRTNNIRRASTANTEAAQSKIATLQLRIGELEEVDQTKQQEVQALYRQLQHQTARATTLEATNAQQQAQLMKLDQFAKLQGQNVVTIQQERDALKDHVDELMQQIAGFENQRKLDQAMRDIEAQIELEQKRKQEYLNQARMKNRQLTSVPGASRGGPGAGGSNMSVASDSVYSYVTVESNPFDDLLNNNSNHGQPQKQQQQQQQQQQQHVSSRLAPNQLGAFQSIVGRQAVGAAVDPFSIATTVRQDDTTTTHNVLTETASASSSVMTGPAEIPDDDDVSRLGDDMSVSTMDALLMQGLTEEQAKEAMAKDAKIASLYDDLREQATKASQLQTLCANQRAQIERFATQLNEKEATLKSTQNNYDFAKSEHDSLYQRFCDIELQLTLEQEKVEGLEKQLHARNHESNLRNDQFKCRFQVQEERIKDLEQQQSSLYAAFELLQQEVKAQDSEHKKIKESLDNADGEVARQLRESEKKSGNNRRSSTATSSSREHQHRGSQRNLMVDGSTTSNMGGSSRRRRHSHMDYSEPNHSTTPVATATPVHAAEAFAGFNDSSMAATPDMFNERTAQRRPIDHKVHTYGYLYKLDKIKGWKKRFFILRGEAGMYELTYSDSPKERVKGTIADITMGVSTVAETNKSSKKPFSFVLHVDPLNHSGQVLHAAALNSDDFIKWITALKAATIRPEDTVYMSAQTNNLSAEAQMEADMDLARRLQSSQRDLGGASSSSGGHHQQRRASSADQESQIEADHLMAMRMQIQNNPNTAYA